MAAILLCLALLAGCSLPGSPPLRPALLEPTPTPAQPHLATTSTPFAPRLTPALAPTLPADSSDPSLPAPILPRYALAARLDYWGHTLAVSETIHYTNNSPDALAELQLDVEANRQAGGFSLGSLAWNDGERISRVELVGNRLVIPLAESLSPGKSLSLILEYQLKLPPIPLISDTTRPVPYGYTERQTNLVDWYPYVVPYRSGSGWLLHQPWSFGEHQVYELAEFDVQISLAEPVEGLVIAASAPVEQSGEVYHSHLPAGRNFAWSASHLYVASSKQVGDVTVTSYVFPGDLSAGEQVLLDSAEALSLYSELISPYPYASLSVVEADFFDGMEYHGLYFLSQVFYSYYDGTPQGYLTTIAAHETAHQWWYSLVGSDQALEPWLDEALCTYSERLFYEHMYPDLLDWWWAFRIEPYQPGGLIDGAIYDYDSPRAYRDTVYLHGAQFLEELRRLLGDQAFFNFLRAYASRNANQQATAEDFFAVLREITSQDLSQLRGAYFSPPQEER